MLSKYIKTSYRLIITIVIAYGLTFQNIAVAADQEYDVEIIVIEDISGKYTSSENWPVVSETIYNKEDNKSGTKSSVSNKRIRILSNETFKLNDEVTRIEASNEYKILLHTAWRQTGLDKSESFPIHISSISQQTNLSDSYVEGDVKLIMSRYLHISGDLVFYKSKQDGYIPYPVKFDRRMKSRETHYIDHPMIGIIVLATPIRR